MSADADVSVVIPTFNRPGLLGATIESVLAQTVRAREIIVVDNGTNPDTAAVLARFGDRVRVLKTEPLGVQVARNAGIDHASSTWIALLDDDDLFLPSYLATATLAMRDGRADVIGTDHIKFEGPRYDAQTNFALAPPGYWDGIATPDAGEDWSFVGRFPLDRLLRRIPIYPSTMIIRKRLAQKIGGYDPRLRPMVTEDIEFLVRALNAGSLALVWKPLVEYRRHSQGVSAGRHAQLVSRWQVFEFVRAHVAGLDPEFLAALAADLTARRLDVFDAAFGFRKFPLHAELAPLLRPGDWTRRRRLVKLLAALPAPLPALIDQLVIRPVRRVRRGFR